MGQKKSRNLGFTLIELLISIAIIAALAIVFLLAARVQISRARDADRKTDLQKIKIVFEDYYNDQNCYPPADILDTCGGSELQPYLEKIPCDPSTKEPYLYLPVSGAACSGYRLFTQLQDENDPSIARVGCDGISECGVSAGYNYGVSAGVSLISTQAESGGGGGPGPGIITGPWACTQAGVCNHYGSSEAAVLAGCSFSFVENNCQNKCSNPAFRCP